MRRNRRTLILTLVVTFLLMLLLTIYTVGNIYRTSYNNVYEVGSDKTTAITADLEKYLENAKSVLWVTADTCTHIEIGAYLTTQLTHRPCTLDALLLIEVTCKWIINSHNLDNMRK